MRLLKRYVLFKLGTSGEIFICLTSKVMLIVNLMKRPFECNKGRSKRAVHLENETSVEMTLKGKIVFCQSQH